MRIIITEKSKYAVFTKLVKLLKNFTETLSTHVKDNGLVIQGTDTTQVTLYHMNLNKSWFSYYEMGKEENITINMSTFEKALSSFDMTDGDEIIILTVDNIINVTHKTPKRKSEITFPLIDEYYQWMQVPESAEWESEMIFKSSDLSGILKKMSLFNDSVKITCTEESIVFETDGESGNSKVDLTLDNVDAYSIVEDGNISVRYPLKFLTRCLDIANVYDKVTLEIATELPLRITWDLEDYSSLSFYVASIIDIDVS
jgi:proliferating cell nuclear antigen